MSKSRFDSNRRPPRSYDQESGMNRTTYRGKKPVKQESSEDDDFSNSEVDQFVGRKYRDDTLRPKTSVNRPSGYRGQPTEVKETPVEATSKDVEVVEPKEPTFGSTSNILLESMTRHIQPAPRTFKKQNFYIPDSANMFEAVHAMTSVLTDNIKLYETLPDYTSIALFLYYAHVYYYQILRAREAIGVLTRFERRSLRIYETVGKPEAWPIAVTMSGFIQALGGCELPNKMYSIVAPAFPDFSKFTANKALQGINSIDGIGRVPIVPAYQQFLYNYAERTAHFDNTSLTYYPQRTPLAANQSFIGLIASTATSADFQTLAFNSFWKRAMETEEPVGFLSRGGVQTRVARWQIPNIDDTHDFSAGMENFLFTDQNDIRWMSHLLRISQGVNKFFPGSSNLGAIPPTTVTENFTLVEYSTNAPNRRTAILDRWYQPRTGWSLNAYPKTYSNSIIPLLQAAVATSTRSSYDGINIIPAAMVNCFNSQSTGPYFVDVSLNNITVPITEADVLNGLDPVIGLSELIYSLYNNDPRQ